MTAHPPLYVWTQDDGRTFVAYEYRGPDGTVVLPTYPVAQLGGDMTGFSSVGTLTGVPDHAVLLAPADAGVDVPPGQPRVLRSLPERLDFTDPEHRRVFDRALSAVSDACSPADPKVFEAVSTVRFAVGKTIAAVKHAERMTKFREQAKELLTGTAEERLDRVADLLRQAEDGPDHDELDYRS